VRDARRRLDQLLLARATGSPSAVEREELARLLAAHPGIDYDTYERAAAAICLATIDTGETMPPSLRNNLEVAAATFVANGLPAPR
jgi:hypothetical protein